MAFKITGVAVAGFAAGRPTAAVLVEFRGATFILHD